MAHRLSRLNFAQIRRIALLLVLAATAAFGGLDTVDKRVTPFSVAEKFSDGQVTVTVERARFLRELKGGMATIGASEPGKVYLGVVANVENTGTVPARLRRLFDLQDLPKTEYFGTFRFRDGSAIQTLGPGLTEELAFTWLVPESSAQSVQAVTIRVWKKEFTQLLVTYGGKEWIDTDDYGQIVVPVEGLS
ncbi:hypothetical protein [Mycolicibacterium celeriflavum]|uniref:hypothetical protein n=1 Tax=Mycolicibacterium celeriflavum TaxID=1249101 RepID=UPI003CFB1A1A